MGPFMSILALEVAFGHAAIGREEPNHLNLGLEYA